jgi:hypothetical protein
MSSPAIASYRLPVADVPRTLGFWAIPVPQLPASNSNSSQGLNCSSPLTNSLTCKPSHSIPMHCTNWAHLLHWTVSTQLPTEVITYFMSLHSTDSNWTDINNLLCPFYTPSAQIMQKKQPLYCGGGVFTAPLYSNGRGTDHIENTAPYCYIRVYCTIS